MSGNPDQTPVEVRRRKIQALSVSVNYADFLECVAPNVRHFDRWLIVTDENDTRTIEVCRRWGMDVLFSKRLYEDGAAFHKAAALNEGLEALDPDAWVAVMDSDILLPHDFRDRLERQPLDEQCLYGLSGRRICATLPEFQSLTGQEPWTENFVYTTFVIGYFNLFHGGQPVNRYPEHGSDDASTYDVIFSDMFPVSRRRYLPFGCLHAGDASVNWRGRVADPFFENHTLANTPPPPSSLGTIASRLGGESRVAAQIGCYDAAAATVLAAGFGRVVAIDHWGLRAGSPSPAMTADLAFLRERYDRGTEGLRTLTPPLPNSDETLDAIADASLDVIWLMAEPEYDFLLRFLPAWLPKLKPGGAITGGFYDPELLPATSTVVKMLIGQPDERFADLRWIRRVPDPAAQAVRLRAADLPAGEQGVVYVSLGDEDVEAILVSMGSLRRFWDGPVCVLSAGDESASLRMACMRLRAGFRNVPAGSEYFPDHLKVLHALEWSPFRNSVYIEAAALVNGTPDFLFRALETADNVFCPVSGQRHLAVSLSVFGWRQGSAALDSLRAVAASLVSIPGARPVDDALSLLGDGTLNVLTSGLVWSGPAKQVPHGTWLQSLRLLARAGAMHLYPPWAAMEQEMMRLLAGS